MILPVEDESKLSESELTRVVRNSDGVFVCSDADYDKELKYLKEKVHGRTCRIDLLFPQDPVIASLMMRISTMYESVSCWYLTACAQH